ncbi:MAG: saccharopine dehydrogenase NADP-binding domain-containing protein [Candidatus Delongbacteria bacterium]|nr:saccharopine dehydrogenase NADP-binding domain-containing protein [Candidatus Delongbacteria bacterium]MBN2834385.1 saccharopine dehydrogenase NADP-binding domain-containing protein [Candidatus Delongbacteria bacterium]
MKVLCLGGAGKISRETVYDLAKSAEFERITVADINQKEGLEVVNNCNSDKVDFRSIDIYNEEEAVKIVSEYDIVMDGTTISQNDQSSKIIAKSNVHGVNFNGFGDEYKYDRIFKENRKVLVPGFGMTPGTTNMMAVSICNKLDKIDTIRISHGAFRPIAFSKSIAETTTYEYDPKLESRVVYENGEFVQVPPFARERFIKLPEPYGTLPQYIIPHSETVTLPQYLKSIGKDANLIEVRGTWPEKNMQLVRALYNWGILKNEKVELNGNSYGIMDVISKYLTESVQGTTTSLYGYALHVEIEGEKEGKKYRYTMYHTHPKSDGSIEEWSGLRAYTKNVALPVAVAVRLIAKNLINEHGVLIPEKVFRPEDVFEGLNERGIFFHEIIEEI